MILTKPKQLVMRRIDNAGCVLMDLQIAWEKRMAIRLEF